MSPTAPEVEEPAPSGMVRQVGQIARALRTSPVGKALLILSASIVGVVLVTAYGQMRLNSWNKPFYDALSRRDLRDFLTQLAIFFFIAFLLLMLNVLQRWLVETLKWRLREALTRDLIGHWMMPRRAFWLSHQGAMGVNPDQRMHQDAHKLSDLTADLGVGLLQATILFFTFAGILWVMSAGMVVRIGGQDHPIPGFMLWAAILYAGFGSVVSWWVGRSLIGRNDVRYAREADLRFSMVRINEHLDGISLASGEADERRRLEIDLAEVLQSTKRLALGLTNLTWVTAGFGWITTVAPTLVAAPLYFSGKISFGGLMMAAAAFTQAQSSLRWFVDNFSVIADWRATLLRVSSFRQVLTEGEGQHGTQSRIAYVDEQAERFIVDDLQVESPSGRDQLQEAHLEVTPGERVLVIGAPGTGKTLLFRALAGLWPWGGGRISRPAGGSMLYVPRGTPYLPRGTLREVLAYPMKVDAFAEPGFVTALSRLGLERLVPMLDVSRRWDRELSQDEQLALAFARIVLQSPKWLLMDDGLGSLDDEALARVVDVLEHELAQAAVINIGRPLQGRDPLFTRTVHLVKVPAALAVAEPPPGAGTIP